MVYFCILWCALCYACSMVLEALNKGWLAEYGERKVNFVRNICKGFMLGTFVAVIILTIVFEIFYN